jgi:hypothetical protein
VGIFEGAVRLIFVRIKYGKDRTLAFLDNAEKEGVVLEVCDDIPKSFLVCDHPYHDQIVYLSELNPSTLQKRAERIYPNRRGES